MAYDIMNSLVDKLADPATGFLDLVNEGLTSDDPLSLKTVSRPPLQDDPTRRAYFVCVGPEMRPEDKSFHYRMPLTSIRRGQLGMDTEIPMHEMDGSMRFINFFLVEGWVPKANTRELCYERGMACLNRLEMALFKLQHTDFFFGVETDDGRETTEGLMQAFGYDGGHVEPLGGDREWYGRIYMRFHVFSKLKQAWFRGEEF